MDCSDARPKLHLLLDHALSAADEAALCGHLEQCPACARQLQDLQSTFEMLHALPAARARAGFVGQVAMRLSDQRHRQGPLGAWARLVLDLALAAAGLLGFVLALLPVLDLADDLAGGDGGAGVVQSLADIASLFTLDGLLTDPMSLVELLHEDALVATNLVGGQVLLGASLVLVVCFVFLFQALTSSRQSRAGFHRPPLHSQPR